MDTARRKQAENVQRRVPFDARIDGSS